MKIVFLLIILVANVQFMQAELVWHEFGITSQVPVKIGLNGAVVDIVRRDVAGVGFKEDNLSLAFARDGSVKHNYWFTSSYGTGAIAMEGRLLFLRYGSGRGTFAREEHVRIYLVGQANDLEEMADVKVSSYVEIPGSKTGDPALVEYKIHVSEDRAAMKVTFIPPSITGIPLPEKSLSVAIKAQQPADGITPETSQPAH